MKRFLFIVLTFTSLLLPGLALAAVPSIDNLTPAVSADNIAGNDLFTPSPADKSMDYLGQLFGTVGGVVHGTSGQLLAELFKVFNYAMVLIACLIMIYTVIVSTVNTAQEGEFMGKKMNSTWVIFRCVAGIGILVPKYTGYSMIQVFIMWVTVQGIGLADKTWTQALTYLSNGGNVYTAPANAGKMGNTVTAVGNIFQSEECMYALQNMAEKDKQQAMDDLKNDPTNPTLMFKATKPVPSYRPVWNEDAKTVSFGFQSKNPDTNKVCGMYSWAKSGDEGDIYEQYKRAGLEQIIMTTSPAAKSLIEASDQDNQTQGQQNSLEQQSISAIVGAAADYENIMLPARNGAQDAAKASWTDNLKVSRAEGWITAGSYYWDLAKINNTVQDSDNNYQPTGSGMVSNMSDYGIDPDALKKKMDFAGKYVDMSTVSKTLQVIQASGVAATPDQLGAILIAAFESGNDPVTTAQNMAGALVAGNADQGQEATVGVLRQRDMESAESVLGISLGATAAATSVSPGVGSLFLVLASAMTSLFILWVSTMNTVGSLADPIAMVQVLGQGMVGIAVSVWVVGSILLGITTTVASMGTSITGVGYGIQNSLKVFVPIVIGFIGVIFVNGMVLSVYVPLIPFMIFTFAAIGWLISVLEAIVAGPLVALGITHPEGHDLLGKAEQAVMLLMGVFLRPVIMIIGFLAAMVMARVTLRIVNAGFGHAAGMANITMSGANIFGIVGLMIVYTMIVLSIINLVFTAGVVKLWENIWMWVGFHQPSSSAETALQEIKSGVHGGAQAMGDFGGGMTKGLGDSLANIIDGKQKEARKQGVQIGNAGNQGPGGGGGGGAVGVPAAAAGAGGAPVPAAGNAGAGGGLNVVGGGNAAVSGGTP